MKPLSHRERVRLALERKETDRIPIAMVCSGVNDPVALERRLRETRGIGSHEYFKPILDIKQIDPEYIGPPLRAGRDIWGVRRAPVSYGPGRYDEIHHHPLARTDTIDALRDSPWPSPDWFDYAGLPARIDAANTDDEYCIMVKGGNIFETAWYMRGFEQALLDTATRPELISAVMERVADFYIETTRRTLAAAPGKIDLVFTADDIGGQEGLLVSLDTWERLMKPHHIRLNHAIHEFDTRIIYHSDGAVMDAVPGLIDMGIDILQALQFDAAGMDPALLKRDYGDRLCFEGGISVQHTLPFGTPDDVRQEVRDRIQILAQGGGYILGPSHAIQVGTPPENILALFDEATATGG